jgi:hypothetical protein
MAIVKGMSVNAAINRGYTHTIHTGNNATYHAVHTLKKKLWAAPHQATCCQSDMQQLRLGVVSQSLL